MQIAKASQFVQKLGCIFDHKVGAYLDVYLFDFFGPLFTPLHFLVVAGLSKPVQY